MTHEPTLLHYVIKLGPRPITLPLTRTLALSSLHSKFPSKREVRVKIFSYELGHHYNYYYANGVANVLPYVMRSIDVSTLQEEGYYYFHSRLKM